MNPGSSASDIDRAIDEYLALDYGKLANLQRAFELYRTQVRRVEEVDGFKIWGPFEARFRAVPVFWDHGHPANSMIKAMTGEALRLLDCPTDAGEIDLTCDTLWGGDEVFKFHAPVHPSVGRCLGLTWVGESTGYRLRFEGEDSIRAFTRRMVTLASDEPRFEVILAWSRGDLGSPETADQMVRDLARAASEGVDYAPFRLQCGHLCDIVRRHEAAIEHYAAGLRLEPGHIGIARRLLRVMDRLGIGSPPATLAPDAPLQFGRGQAGVASLRDGWAPPDEGGVWSLGPEASLILNVPEDAASPAPADV